VAKVVSEEKGLTIDLDRIESVTKILQYLEVQPLQN